MTRLTEEQLADLELLEKEATPGPWGSTRTGDVFGPAGMPSEHYIGSGMDAPDRIVAVAARNALPSILAEVRRLRRVEKAAGCAAGLSDLVDALGSPSNSVHLDYVVRNLGPTIIREWAALRAALED